MKWVLKEIFELFLKIFLWKRWKNPTSYNGIKLKVLEIFKKFWKDIILFSNKKKDALDTLLSSIENYFQFVERKDLLNELVSFRNVWRQEGKQQKTLIDERVYFACPVGDNIKKVIKTDDFTLPNGNYSDHITIAFPLLKNGIIFGF